MATDRGARIVASQVPFQDLCSLLEKIHNTKGTDKKKDILRSFIRSWREIHSKIHETSKTVSVYKIFYNYLLLSIYENCICNRRNIHYLVRCIWLAVCGRFSVENKSYTLICFSILSAGSRGKPLDMGPTYRYCSLAI